ncbi:TetR family transcriptional regulator [Corynebacterium sp.]|jgi:AcrR family transcriptional regulator|uniref:TetR/AcrR family transcriptional regulator n=1 Tax=Corynebacterium sp. TaxID=1720 RepID=UPI0025C699B0|nr:TetR family transcriptional regulator [Corynebacterium sp.]
MRTTTRRDEIFDAVDRLIGREGIPAVSMRAVAAEAGVSLRLVQYYGTDKNTLLAASLRRLSDRSIRRWRERRAPGASLRAVIEGYFAATLPVDEETCAFHRISVSMELMAVTGTEPAASAYRAHLAATGAEFTAACLEAVPELGEETADSIVNTAMALGHGLGSLLMAGRVSEASARATVAAMVGDLPD